MSQIKEIITTINLDEIICFLFYFDMKKKKISLLTEVQFSNKVKCFSFIPLILSTIKHTHMQANRCKFYGFEEETSEAKLSWTKKKVSSFHKSILSLPKLRNCCFCLPHLIFASYFLTPNINPISSCSTKETSMTRQLIANEKTWWKYIRERERERESSRWWLARRRGKTTNNKEAIIMMIIERRYDLLILNITWNSSAASLAQRYISIWLYEFDEYVNILSSI